MFRTKNYVRHRFGIFSLVFLFLFPSFTSAQVDSDLYCIPDITIDELYISHFHFNNIDNPSGNNGYTYYPTPVATIIPGFSYNYTMVFPSYGQKYYAVYMDLNGDGDFDETNETMDAGSTTNIEVNSTIIIPAAIGLNGQARMRIIVSYDPIVHPCEPVRGEVEDYTIEAFQATDPDWDIVVTSGIFIPNQNPNTDYCGSVAFYLESRHCSNNFPFGGPQTVAYGLKIMDSNGAMVMTVSKSAPIASNGYSQQIEEGLYNNQFTTFYPGETYTFFITHGLSNTDVDCSPFGPDFLTEQINEFPECKARENGTEGLVDEEVNSDQANTIRLDASTEAAELMISPNPFNDQVEISFKLEAPVKELKIGLYNLLGRQVAEEVLLSDLPAGNYRELLDVSQLRAGTYYLLIESENLYHTEKLLKLH